MEYEGIITGYEFFGTLPEYYNLNVFRIVGCFI